MISEKRAFYQAINTLKKHDMKIESIRLIDTILKRDKINISQSPKIRNFYINF